MQITLAILLGCAAIWTFRALLRHQHDRIVMESLAKYIRWSNGHPDRG